MNDNTTKRQTISRLMREAAHIFSQASNQDITPALPKMYAAVHLADQLEDKTPLVICEANLASMNAVCGHMQSALEHIERAIEVSRHEDLPASIRSFACTKFVEISILLGCERKRALLYARELLINAAEDENSSSQFFAAAFNLAVVSNDLFNSVEWALSLLSWICEEAQPDDHPICLQARRYYDKVAQNLPEEVRLTSLCEIESNRDFFLAEATNNLLPGFKPQHSHSNNDWNSSGQM